MPNTEPIDTAYLDRLAWQCNTAGAPSEILDAIQDVAQSIRAWQNFPHLTGAEAVAEEILRTLGIGGTGRAGKAAAVAVILRRRYLQDPEAHAERVVRSLGLPVSRSRLEAVQSALRAARES